ncbi:hypothetical protein OG2516_09670 [Oceanicola granulosus HTCC2516]|uniref:Lipoprotein n=2 Tax=Oceanicola granulosus TaxID=252302 RepID=Q2CCX0_OCEGH|nr:hypothetical protein OG2516_09670 [Oceanicola granulosus HTCC2516]
MRAAIAAAALAALGGCIEAGDFAVADDNRGTPLEMTRQTLPDRDAVMARRERDGLSDDQRACVQAVNRAYDGRPARVIETEVVRGVTLVRMRANGDIWRCAVRDGQVGDLREVS